VIFQPLAFAGLWSVRMERREDERGFFARSFCAEEFERHGLSPRVAQCSVSHSRHRGTLRGLHWQETPHAEAKLVRCTRGRMYDVIVDLRRDSPSFARWTSVELAAATGDAVYVPEGMAHGFQTLEDDTDVLYQMSVPHHPASARGIRWNDPRFAIAWPIPDPVLSEADRTRPDFRP
jgi:dTDP-4-dehydrorhamnose 3,5-epimerase